MGAAEGFTRCSAATNGARSRAAWVGSMSSVGVGVPSAHVKLSQNLGYSSVGWPWATRSGISSGPSGASLGCPSTSLPPDRVGPFLCAIRPAEFSPRRSIWLSVAAGLVRRSGRPDHGHSSSRSWRTRGSWIVAIAVPLRPPSDR